MGIESLAVPPGAACRGDSRFGGAARSSVLWLDSKFGGASRGGGQHAKRCEGGGGNVAPPPTHSTHWVLGRPISRYVSLHC